MSVKVRYGEPCRETVGLSRSYEGAYWPIVIGTHLVPDYAAEVDYDNW